MLSITAARQLRIARLAAASSVALALAACGGGGGSFVESTPTPPPAPPPPPPPVAISAPARATVGPGVAPVVAVSGGPNFTAGAAIGTTFPLLQTTVAIDASGIKPDVAVNTAGGTATITAGGLAIGISGMQAASYSVDPNLDWTRVGEWAFDESPWDYGGFPSQRGAFVTGYETPAGAMPTAGSATFQGSARGTMFSPASASNGLPCPCSEVSLGGTASFTADFGARTLDGTLTGMSVGGTAPWNDVAFTSAIMGSSFSGTTSVTTAPTGAMGLNATGTLDGSFFGPSAQEAGAAWTLFDGTNAAIGTISGRRGP